MVTTQLNLNKEEDITQGFVFLFEEGVDDYYNINAYYKFWRPKTTADMNYSFYGGGSWICYNSKFNLMVKEKDDNFKFVSSLDKWKIIPLIKKQANKYNINLKEISDILFNKNEISNLSDKIIINFLFNPLSFPPEKEINIASDEICTSFYYKSIFLFSIQNELITGEDKINFCFKNKDFKGIYPTFERFELDSDKTYLNYELLLYSVYLNNKQLKNEIIFNNKLTRYELYYLDKKIIEINPKLYNLEVEFIKIKNNLLIDCLRLKQLDLWKNYGKYNTTQRKKIFEFTKDCLYYGINYKDLIED